MESPDPAEKRKAPLMQWRWVWTTLCCAAIAAAVLLAYSDSLHGPFIFDDSGFFSLSSSWPHRARLILTGLRPVADLTFALNYALLGPDVLGFHWVNLAIHLLAALTLFGVARRTLELPALDKWFGERAATPVAFCIALIWAVHPLLTQAVTYVVQRAESLMGLFFLLTLYCFIRAASARRPGLWQAGAVAACALGMGCKQVMVVAPLVALFYDRCFLSGTFREALRRRRGLYLALAATWLVMARSLLEAVTPRPISAGFALPDVGPIAYARNETAVILHYLRLAFWPDKLCLDYGWAFQSKWATVPTSLVMAILLAITLWALVRKPAWGFLGAWFFLILAPTSSFMPIRDLAFEQRMYLPLAAVVALMVLWARWLIVRATAGLWDSERACRWTRIGAAAVLMLPLTLALGGRTYARNLDYRDTISIWTATTKASSRNPRAWSNLGYVCLNASPPLYAEAISYCDEAIRLKPDYADPYNHRGVALAAMNRTQEALRDYDEAIRLNPKYADAYINRANALDSLGRMQEAVADFNQAAKVSPNHPKIYINRAITYYRLKEYAKALADLQKYQELGGVLEGDLLGNITRAMGGTRTN